MNERQLESWCHEHGWTELRRLDNYTWVAFPPGGYIETPLPYQQLPPFTHYKFNSVAIALCSCLLLLALLGVACLSICLAPYFWFYSWRKRS